MTFTDVTLTTGEVAWFTGFVAGVDLLLTVGIWRFYPTDLYRRLSRWVMWASFLFYTALWSSVLAWGWDWFYVYIFPPWVRYTGLVWGIGYGGAGWLIWWVSQRLPGKPAVNFCLLGILEGLLTHLLAIYGLGAVAKPPIMQGVDPETVLIFAGFEKCFYWTVILLLAGSLAHWVSKVRHRLQVE